MGCAILAATLWSAAGNVAHAQGADAVKSHAAAGDAACVQSDPARAAKEYEEAFRLGSDATYLRKSGDCYDLSGQAAEAVRWYRRYLDAATSASDRSEVERRIADLEQQGGTGGAAPGGASGSTITPPPPPPKPAAQGVEKPSKLKQAAWAMLGATIAFGTGGAVMGLAAEARSDEVERRLRALDSTTQRPPVLTPTLRDQLATLEREGRSYQAAAIALWSVAGASAITTIVLFVTDHRMRQQSRDKHMLVAPSLGPRHAGVTAVWEF
jgi:tetratricopeptide (TPR) repeat protein